MGHPPIRLYRTVPSSGNHRAIIRSFCRGSEVILTSFEETALPVIQSLVADVEDIVILPFGSLVRRMLDHTGQPTQFIANKAEWIAALDQARDSLDDESPMKSSLRHVGLRQIMPEMLSELSNWEVDIGKAATSLSPASNLALKLTDLSKLESRATSILARMGRSTSAQQLHECLQTIIDPDVNLPKLLIVGGSEFTPLKAKWLRWLASQGAEIGIIGPRHPQDASFFPQWDDAQRILSENGSTCEIMEVGGGNRLTETLFTAASSGAAGIEAAVAKFANPTAECEWAITAADSKTTIYVRDLSSYAPLLEHASKKLGKSVKIQRRTPLTQNAFVRLILDTLKACNSNDVRSLLPILRKSYIQWGNEDRVFVRNAIESARNEPLQPWNALADAIKNGSDNLQWISKLLSWRTRALSELGTLADWFPILDQLVDLLPWHATAESCSGYDLQRDERAFNVMHSSLATAIQLEAGVAKPKLGLRQFLNRCQTLWNEADVSIPAKDGISVVSSASGIPPSDQLIVLGMLEGIFPRRRRENPVLGDAERALISEKLPTSRDLAIEDRQEFFLICVAAESKLIMCYPEIGDDDKDNIPAFYINRVEEALGSLKEIDKPPAPPDPVHETQPQKPRLNLELGGPLLARERSVSLTPSQLRDALKCPFQFQMRHNLKIDPRSSTTAWYRLRFIPENAKLVSLKGLLEAEQALEEALSREIERLAPELGDWELRLLQGGGQRLILDWIKREFGSRKIWPKTPEAHGVRAIGEVGLRELIPGDIKLNAKVAGITHLSPSSKVIHLFETSTPNPRQWSDEGEKLYYGLYFLAAHESGFESAIEVDGLDGNRKLLVIDRDKLPRLINRKEENLEVIDLSGDLKAETFLPQFMKEVKKSLAQSARIIREGVITATPGESCLSCDYGELCRQSIVLNDGRGMDGSTDD